MTKEAHFSSEFKETALFAPPSLLERLESLDASQAKKGELAAEIEALSAAYTRERGDLRDASTSASGLRARLRFFLPRDLPKAGKPLLEATSRGLLPKGKRLRVLDLGAGLGTTSLSLLRVLHLVQDERSVEILAIDQDAAALSLARSLLSEPIEGFVKPSALRWERADLMRLEPQSFADGERFELILIGLALNELREREGLLEAIGSRLVEGGLILIIEPALKDESRALMALRDDVATRGDLRILGPCLHHAPCPMLERKRDWCHDAVSGEHPEAIAALAESAGLRASRPTFSWLLLERPFDDSAANVSESALDSATGKTRGRIVSHRLASKGKLEFQLCALNGELITLRRLDRHRAAANRIFDELARGDRVEIDGELRKGALRLTEESEISRI